MKMTIRKRLPLSALALLPLLLLATTLHSQALTDKGSKAPTLEAGFNYSWLHANAPAGSCGCFSANGGSGDVVLNLPRGIGFVAEVSGYKASGLLGTTQKVALIHALFGGRYTVPTHTRLRPYAQALAGFSHENSNFVYIGTEKAFASSAGGGAHLQINRHVGINLVQADWVHSTLLNGTNNRQNDLRLGAGVYFTLTSR